MHSKFALLAAGMLIAPALTAQAQVGDRPEFTFSAEPMFGAGAKSLDDLKGRPTIIEFWGTR